MCRNIRTLHNFNPPATDEEVQASALQYVRKISGYNKPSQANQAAFDQAVQEVATLTHRLLRSLVAIGAPKNRDIELQKARERWKNRATR